MIKLKFDNCKEGNMTGYIHYGHKNFDLSKFQEISNREMFVKPLGGLWGSPINAEFGWKDWCEAEEFKECNEDNSFKFILSENANIYYINCKEDIMKLPSIEYPFHTPWINLDFEMIKANGIDAIQFNLSNDKGVNFEDQLYYLLYGWDCDSILILTIHARILPLL